MLERGGGYLLNTASAGGLLVEFHSAPYTTTKHAAVGLAEWHAVTYGDQGIAVSVLCPAGVTTPMTADTPGLLQNAISTEQLADIVMAAIAEERFLISTHDFVLDLFRLKGANYHEYITVMKQQRANYAADDTKTK
jgi:NAD(P)-dependent dehydrogenase (short-subunit alcohol dehydrogenase family)